MPSDAALPIAVQDALNLIRRHPRVRSAKVLSTAAEKTQLEVEFDTDLPSRWRAKGVSPTAVKAVEPVSLIFGSGFPMSAPGIYLRPDFNRSLPHINPHKEGDPVPPCVVFGDTTEYMHREGFTLLLDQLAIWLRNAGRGELILFGPGWEPVRRDAVESHLIFDPAEIATLVSKQAGYAYLQTSFVATREGLELALGRVGTTKVHLREETVPDIFGSSTEQGVQTGKTFTILCWPGKLPTGKPFICDQYLPETVANYGDLVARADSYGCGEPLRTALKWLRTNAQKLRCKLLYPIFVILAALRPAQVIGTSSPLELLAYRFDINFPWEAWGDASFQVEPVAHSHPVTVPLLRRMSGVDADVKTPKMTMVGCGSLGSKIGSHLARAGMAPSALIDSRSFRPHNSARHVLFPGDNVKALLPPSKAQALADVFAEFGGPRPLHRHGNILNLRSGSADFKRLFPADLAITMNTTASHAVRDQLRLLGSALPGRVVEGALADDGRIGLLTIEGLGRNPDTTDLMAAAYEELRSEGRLAALAGLSTRPTRLAVGVGCDSITLVMNDARVSQHAAAMGARMTDWMTNGFPEQALVHIGMLGDDEMSLSWRRVAVGPTHEISAENDTTWTIRILDRAHRGIQEEIDRWTAVETGGVIVGRVSPHLRLVHVTDVIDAPPDSERSPSLLVLGTERLTEFVDAYESAAAGALWCLGTWHNHLAEQGGSPQDYATAKLLEGRGRRAVVMLIRRPTGYSAIVKAGG
jgi:hypothetical protein